MTVLYLTTHVLDDHFEQACHRISSLPNPAGQNFHGKLIRSLATALNVRVYSFVPASLSYLGNATTVLHERLSYTYLQGPKNRYLRGLFFPSLAYKRILQSLNEDPASCLLYDPLNQTIAKVAEKLSKKLNCPRYAILTDDIENITGVSPSFCAGIKKKAKTADGSIALTKGLVKTYGLEERPSFIQPFLTEASESSPKKRSRPYIYYGGALFEKDGTKDLLEWFQRAHPNYDLLLSGHGAMEEEVRRVATGDPHIEFLGQISKQEHYAYIQGCALAINPRHYNKRLDDNAVPSKVMEYLSFAPFVASTLSTPIHDEFEKDVNWINGDLDTFFQNHLDENGNLVELLPNQACKTILKEYGPKETGLRLKTFLTSSND
ncbi:MAG: glycosyltransferase [Bacilli bacterium]|nr:glycosyltransferase [Bacilli bacterium]